MDWKDQGMNGVIYYKSVRKWDSNKRV